MRTLIAIGLGLIALADGEQPLAVQRLYHAPGRPVAVSVETPAQQATLVLLAADGEPVSDARDVAPGVVDLAELFPGIWDIRRACFLQCVVGGEPIGSAMVVQPMIARREPRTETVTRPDGTPFTRVTGWGAPLRARLPGPEPPPGRPRPAPPPGTDETTLKDRHNAVEPDAVVSGLRIYPERDVVLHTSKGEIVIALRPDEAPNTVWSFRHLVEEGFYDEQVFHRVVPLTRAGHAFVIQGGDPTGQGSGGPGYWLPLENSRLAHDFGVISMARADHPDSAGSQFFISLSREGTAALDGQYCSFGYAVDGADTILALAAVDLSGLGDGRPLRPPLLREAQLIPSPPRTPGRGRPDLPVAARDRVQPDRLPR